MVDSIPPPYKIERLLGSGGMADVYLAWNEDLRRREALKFLSSRLAPDEALSSRFLNEARVAAGLHHPHIAAIYTVSDPRAPRAFFAMQHIAGGDLADRLEGGAQMPLETAKRLLAQIADALDYAHGQGVVHRDVKPANVLLDERNGEPCAYVVDFGIARAQEGNSDTRLTRAGMIVGTPEYMSPEQAGVGGEVGSASDQYALAIVAYEMLCGKVPFPASERGSEMSVLMAQARDVPPPPASLRSGLPKPIEKAILKALSKNPADRFPSCRAFVEAFDASTPVPRKPASGERPVTPSAPNRIPLALGAVVVAGLAMMVFATVRGHDKGDPPPPTGGGTSGTTGGSGGEKEEERKERERAVKEARAKFDAKLETLRDIDTNVQSRMSDLKSASFKTDNGSLLMRTEAFADDLAKGPYQDLHDNGRYFLARKHLWLALNEGYIHDRSDKDFRAFDAEIGESLRQANLAATESPDADTKRALRVYASNVKMFVHHWEPDRGSLPNLDSLFEKIQ